MGNSDLSPVFEVDDLFIWMDVITGLKITLSWAFVTTKLYIAIPAFDVIFKTNLKVALELHYPNILHLIPYVI